MMRDHHQQVSRSSPENTSSTVVDVVVPEIVGTAASKAASEDDDNGSVVNYGDDEPDGEENLDQSFEKTPPLRPELTRDHIKFCALLGRGSFGRVHLALNSKDPTEMLAVKVLTRHTIAMNGWETMVENEVKAMLELSGQTHALFLLRILNVFVDLKNVYLVLTLCPGGDLFCLMSSFPNGRFSEEHARFYFACVVLGLKTMQERDIAYRDLKPENLMIDKKGYIKIADFGLAKKTLRTFTVCGTPEYMAPEILLSRGHAQPADWWAAGIVLHEILCGETPFTAPECMEVYEKVLNHERVDDLVWNHDFGEVMSANAKDLITQLIHPKKTKRIGVKFPGVLGAMQHPFFAGFDWDKLADLSIPAPVIPNISQVESLAHGDNVAKYNPKLDTTPDDNSGWTISF